MRKRNVAILFRLNKKEAEVLDKKVKKIIELFPPSLSLLYIRVREWTAGGLEV